MDRKYDTYVPSALPSASLGRRRGPPIGGVRQFGDEEPTDDLEKSYVQWNTRIDKEVKAVVEGLGDVVRLADLGTPAPGAHTLSALHLKLRTSSLIRAAQQLRDTAHELSLALALGDDVGAAVRRDDEVGALRREVERLRGEIAREVGVKAGGEEWEQGEAGGADRDGDEGDGDGEGERDGEREGEGNEDGDAGESGDVGGREGEDGEAKGEEAGEDARAGMEVDDDEDDEFEEV